MFQSKLGRFRDMETIPEGFYKTDGTYIYIVGPLVVCAHNNGTDPQSGVRVWSVNIGLAHTELPVGAYPPPICCPFCGGSVISTFMVEWFGRSMEPQDSDNTGTLHEHQCHTCARSFWS